MKNCVYNAGNCCCKAAVAVDGNKAKSSEQICCASFDKDEGAGSTNLFKTPEIRLEIACDIVECVYNEEYRYSAERTGISGDGACDYAETKCNTFKTRQGYRGRRDLRISPVSMWDERREGKRTREDKGL